MQPQTRQAGYALPEIQYSMTASGGLGWREAGQGPCVVLLHGISSGSTAWARQLSDPALTEHYRLLAWDAPGYGDSDPLVSSHPSAEAYAEVLFQWLDRWAVWPVILVGHSLGALMAAAFAARYPERVQGVVLADPAQGYARHDSQKRQAVYQQRVDQITALGPVGYAEQRAEKLLKPDPLPENLAQVRYGMSRLQAQGFCQAAWMLANDDLTPYLRDTVLPVEVWCGACDTITPPEGARQLAQQHNWPFVLLPEAGHASYLDAAPEFNQQLRRFCQQCHLKAPRK